MRHILTADDINWSVGNCPTYYFGGTFMSCFSVSSCSVCTTPPEPFTNTAAVAGRYVCPAGCSGDISAVSEPVVVEVVDVSVDKSVYPACVRAGQTVHYTITVCNRSSVAATCVEVTDPEIENLLDVGTIYVNGQPVRGGCLSRGIRISGLGAGCCAAVTFDAVVPDDATGTISNTAYAEFQFESTACAVTAQTAASSEVVLSVIAPSLEITKEADRCSVTPEENVITFTLTVTNTGTCPVENVVVTDVLPSGLSYVANSTSVNGDAPINQNPAAGVSLGTLDLDEEATVSFQAEAAF